MSFLVAGSLAYDILYTHDGIFNDVIRLDHAALSVAFNVQSKAILRGGCGGNIVFGARCVGGKAQLLGIAGHDYEDYAAQLKKHGILSNHVVRVPNDLTSQAAVVTDKRGQQITFFFEGASRHAKKYAAAIKKSIATSEARFVHVAPNSKDFMMLCINESQKQKIPFYFDPGQALPLFTKKELRDILKHTAGVFLNEYERNMLVEKSGFTLDDLKKTIPLIVVTLAENGSEAFFEGNHVHVPSKSVKKIADPTGCGDAYRGGFLTVLDGVNQKLTPSNVVKAGELGTELALKCLKNVGTQTYC